MYYYRKTNQVTNVLNVLGVLVFFYILMEAEIKESCLGGGYFRRDPGTRGRYGRCQGSLYWLEGCLEPGGERQQSGVEFRT